MRGTWQTTYGGGGGLVLAVVAAAVLIGSGAASAAMSAIVTILIVIGSVIGAAALGGIAFLVYRARQDRTERPISARPVYQLPREPRPELPPPHEAAIGPGRELHIHLHGLTPEQVAAILTHRHA